MVCQLKKLKGWEGDVDVEVPLSMCDSEGSCTGIDNEHLRILPENLKKAD
jgi:hypothetical protein